MARCISCHAEHSGREECCDICGILMTSITGQESSFVTDPSLIATVIEDLGGRNNTLPKIWRALRGLDGGEADWAMEAEPWDERMWITDAPDPWEIDLSRMDRFYRNEGEVPEINELRALQRGGCLPDGSYLTWNGGRFYLDGMKIRLPYRGLSKMLRKLRGRDDVDFRRLLLSVDLAVRKSPGRGFFSWRGRDGATVTHPVYTMLMRRGYGNRYQEEDQFAEYRIIQQNDRARMRFFEKTSWMKRWRSAQKDTPLHHLSDSEFEVPYTLAISNGRLQLRVRRNTGWRRIELDSDPLLWSRVVSWVLSPPRHRDRNRLHCIQQHLFVDEGMPLISESEQRGVSFLRRIVAENDRVEIDRPSKSITVTGTSGLSYSVVPTLKGEGARFSVWPLDENGAQSRLRAQRGGERGRHWMNASRLCIVELPELRRLVIGDAVATIVMSLLDDMNSQNHIHTLRMHVAEHLHRERNERLGEINEARMLRERLMRNRIGIVARRNTELLPRLWSALLRRPLGERLTFTAMNRGRPNIWLDGCETRFETTSQAERQVLYSMLHASGWVRDQDEERLRGNTRIYIRTGTGQRDLGQHVESFCELMEAEVELGEGARFIPDPLSTFYERENPGIAELLPGTDQLIG